MAGHEETSDATICPPALEIPGGPKIVGSAAATLTASQLSDTVAAALARWQVAGLTAEQAARLAAVEFRVGSLPEGQLVRTRGDAVLVDRNAAGFGWFVDPTPAADTEYAPQPGGLLAALAGSGAEGQADLLTAVLHEMGHAMGLDDVDILVDPAALMADELALGTRRLPTALDVDAVFAEGEF